MQFCIENNVELFSILWNVQCFNNVILFSVALDSSYGCGLAYLPCSFCTYPFVDQVVLLRYVVVN